MTTYVITVKLFNAPSEEYTIHDYNIEDGILELIHNYQVIAVFSPTHWASFNLRVL